jgi:predicted Zn-dependent protease
MREWRYRMYLQVGNMSDILNMTLNDFKSVVDMMIHQGTPPEKRFKKMSESQKNMIKRKKELG